MGMFDSSKLPINNKICRTVQQTNVVACVEVHGGKVRIKFPEISQYWMTCSQREAFELADLIKRTAEAM